MFPADGLHYFFFFLAAFFVAFFLAEGFPTCSPVPFGIVFS
jgi:hypothetical protein